MLDNQLRRVLRLIYGEHGTSSAGLPSLDKLFFTTQTVPAEDIQSARLVILFELLEGRNTWQDWKDATATFRRDAGRAKDDAENIRTQGSKFEIRQTYGTAFFGTSAAVVIPRWPSRYGRFRPGAARTLPSLAETASGKYHLLLAEGFQFETSASSWSVHESETTPDRLNWHETKRSTEESAEGRAYLDAVDLLARYLAAGIFADGTGIGAGR